MNGEWKPQCRRRNLRTNEAIEINELMETLNSVSLNSDADSWEWKWNKDKVFSVKSFYNNLLKAHKKGRILKKDRLYEKHIVEDNLCNLRNSSNITESCLHLFLECPLVAQVWQKLIGHLP
ncbi:hypothetical protein FRX31_008490 [Thalictrum thalictroides]|uniref:Reverse transcriptase zinc-binding domain-containing protein n=1 Tax=Thalictrum thalictroides TaxID=46969 RepID=A0A7J6WXX4_THATH|nr:hypothetical protein FRX31_008490 [Thalictrum thalictroides]